MYDLEKLSWIIASKRKRFKILLALYICLVIIGAVLFFIGEMNVVFCGIIIAIIAVALIFKLIRSYSPSVLFSSEKRGILVKEHEYVATVKRGLSGRATVAKRTAGTHSSSGNAKSRRPHVRSAYIYVRDGNENVLIFDGLTSLHTDIYEIGDEVLRPAGARYPIIVAAKDNRKIEKQPCPLCGRINEMNKSECVACGLSINKITE